MSMALRMARVPACVVLREYHFGVVSLQQHQKFIAISALRLFASSSGGTPKGIVTSTKPAPCTPSEAYAEGAPKKPTLPPTSSNLVSTKPPISPAPTCDKEPVPPPSNMSSRVVDKTQKTSEAMRQNVKGYVFTRYFDYVKNYDKLLEKNFPSAVKVYRVFFDGVKDFYADMKRYLKISRIVNISPEGLRALNRSELELYMQMPRDMVKVAPALIGSSLPMVGYAFFPIVFMYPRTFLTKHFWSLQQRAEFQQLALQERLAYNRPVLRCLQAKLRSLSDLEDCDKMGNILGLVGSGFHPTVEELLGVKNIFAAPPYNLVSLSGKHVKLLCMMHGLSSRWFKRHRLYEHAFLVHHMDLAIGREGGVHNMNPDSMRYSAYLRGLNPANMNNEELVHWMREWIRVSTSIQEEHISLFLHLPLFLGYNHPNNWQLIYNSKQK